MPWYCLYEVASGRIGQFMNIPHEEAALYSVPGMNILNCGAAPSLTDNYVNEGSVVPRPSLPAFDKTSILANGTDTAILVGLPDPCAVLVNGQEHSIVGGTLELDADYPGTYRVEIRQFPYRDFVQEITAT